MSKHEGMQNDRMADDGNVASSFGLGASFVIRHLDFVIDGAGFLISLARLRVQTSTNHIGLST
jgi:hypothetical protein